MRPIVHDHTVAIALLTTALAACGGGDSPPDPEGVADAPEPRVALAPTADGQLPPALRGEAGPLGG